MNEQKSTPISIESNRTLQIVLGVIGLVAFVSIGYVIYQYEKKSAPPDVVIPYKDDGKINLTKEETAEKQAIIDQFISGRTSVTLSKEETKEKEEIIKKFMSGK